MLALTAGRPPAPGGSLAVVLPDDVEGRRIGTALTRRMTLATLTRPDGSASHLHARPATAGARLDSVWILTLDIGRMPRVARSALETSLPELLATATSAPWTDLRAVITRSGDGRARPDTLLLSFDGPVPDPRDRFARWPVPRSVVDGAFRPVSAEGAGPTGRFVRSPVERTLEPGRLNEITVLHLPAPATVNPGMLVITRAGAGGAGAAPGADQPPGDAGGVPPADPGEPGLEIVYVVRVPRTLSPGERAWLRHHLTPSAFSPLVPDVERGRTDLWPGCETAGPEATPVPPAGNVVVIGGDEGRPGLLTRRARLLLATAREDGPPPVEGAPGVEVRVEPVVVFERSPATDPRVLTGPGEALESWPVVTVRYEVRRGEVARGRLGAPDRWWRVPEWRSPEAG